MAKPTRLRDLTPEPGRALDGEAFELTPDGSSVLAEHVLGQPWERPALL